MKTVTVTGTVRSINKNDKGGITVQVRSDHGDGKGANSEWFDLFGNYASVLMEKKVIAVGDIVTVSYEEPKVLIADRETGKADKWCSVKRDVKIHRTFRPASEKVVAPVIDKGLDTETY